MLVGSLTPREREQALADIAAGEVDLVIGTHAVVQEDVRFAKLGLVVIDEQHKFGVRQRAALRQGQRVAALPGDDGHADPADDQR